MVIAIMWLRNINLFWVELYMMSMGHGQNAEGRKYEVYFISKVHKVGTSDSVPDGARPIDTKTMQQEENPSGNDYCRGLRVQ